jgi:predicted transcriptional regulator
MNLGKIVQILKADILVGNHLLEVEVNAGAASDLMSDILRGPTSGSILLTGLNNIQVIRTAVISGLAAVAIIRGKMPGEDMIALAEENTLPLIRTPFSMFVAVGRLYSNGLLGVDRKPMPEGVPPGVQSVKELRPSRLA